VWSAEQENINTKEEITTGCGQLCEKILKFQDSRKKQSLVIPLQMSAQKAKKAVGKSEATIIK
jgi:hypothetical protein